MTNESRQRDAMAILAAIGTGSIPLHYFTADARWWWNGGLDLTVPEFLDILAQLHGQMTDGVQVIPGLVLAQGDHLMIEATSDSPLKDGRRYNNRYIFLFRFAGGRVGEVREYSDSAHVLATFEL
ncbi:nuclear transport factor 2 family protein [Sphingobium boeckii]|uniref:SnoaL-like domain-containing protein n=1 Tax=Sphingobium boeckii TaxID=1082345 RepID=A0A7W9AI22_9SPHN|nr:nuclear transport factor 2 family protein [Sphingobium boeckii]MBB5685902.1 hypothetical protein [Sphingobium boeckii]